MDSSQITTLLLAHKWVPLAAVVVGFIVRLLKDDSRLPTVPARARVWLVFALGLGAGVLERVANGTSWRESLLHGSIAAVLAILGHETLIKSARNGKEIPLPSSLEKKSPPAPKPETPPDLEVSEKPEDSSP